MFFKNTDEIKLFENAGFRKEAVLFKEALDLEGNELDVVRLVIFKNEYDEKKLLKNMLQNN